MPEFKTGVNISPAAVGEISPESINIISCSHFADALCSLDELGNIGGRIFVVVAEFLSTPVVIMAV